MTDSDHATLLDQQRIKNVIDLYFAGLDRKAPKLLEDVFTPDAAMSVLGGQQTISGRANIIEMLMAVEDFDHTSHFATSQLITVEADRAAADTFAIAYVVLPGPGARIMVRGLQYLDALVRTPLGWRIAERQHIPTWQFDADSVPANLPS